MGSRTTLYGFIEEMDFWQDPVKSMVRKHNASIIRSLPIADPWPPVSREMFSICANYKKQTGPNLEYRARIIHFGTSLKSVEDEWAEWKLKFEKLLTRLYFYEAKVHLIPESMSNTTSSWWVDCVDKYEILHNGKMPPPVKPEHIVYEGSPLDEMFG